MTECWEQYFGEWQGNLASVLVNTGLASEAPLPHLPKLAFVRIQMKAPRPDGFSSSEEADALNHLEDLVTGAVSNFNPPGMIVGRLTSGGCRDRFYYVGEQQDWPAPIRAVIQAAGYQSRAGSLVEKQWETYFELLLPDEEQRQSIRNAQVCEALSGDGDPLLTPREIDHWISNSEARAEFQRHVAPLGFETRELLLSEDETSFGIQIFRTDVPAFWEIDDVTHPLFRLAKEYGGKYDGWETRVMKS